jgi:hypothetical protein
VPLRRPHPLISVVLAYPLATWVFAAILVFGFSSSVEYPAVTFILVAPVYLPLLLLFVLKAWAAGPNTPVHAMPVWIGFLLTWLLSSIALHQMRLLARRDISTLPPSMERICMQISHRLAAVALFATVAAWVLVYRSQDSHWAVAVAFGASDVAFMAAMLAWMGFRAGEAVGAMAFNGILLALSLQMILFTRIDLIRTVLGKFLTPD